ncbi:integral membrane protein [Colletotrichum karsti]|uniref:Integral membrane protein n=1 Tax=Colletotrichum karsti TaxID=1095194 RepID=A0A9P6I9C1_9PEZI|nr:uncharacterized protein CkaCkLH20_04402 [Colletotrichum karsti]KAF9878364.1 integral membrane protein [Colletotrichum karsti]
MHIRKKVALSIALGFGSISSIVVIYKCTRLPLLASPDPTYDAVELVIWTIVEGSIIIIAACVPVLQPLAEIVFGKRIFSSSSRRYTHQNSGGKSMGMFGHQGKKEPQRFGADSFNSLKTTIVTKGSQESILEKYDSDGRIVRTDAFTVTVETDKA